MQITDKRKEPEVVIKNCNNINAGTVFTGQIHGVRGPWYKTIYAIINLRDPGASYTHPEGNYNYDVIGYEARDAELVLR